MPTASALALIGGLALVAAYFMPWFGVQGILLTGAILTKILGNASDVRRFLPTVGDGEVALLRELVLFFPIAGGAGAALALLETLWARSVLALLTAVLGIVILVALVGGITRLPPGSTLDAGVWTMAAGAVALAVAGAWAWRSDRAATSAPSSPDAG